MNAVFHLTFFLWHSSVLHIMLSDWNPGSESRFGSISLNIIWYTKYKKNTEYKSRLLINKKEAHILIYKI